MKIFSYAVIGLIAANLAAATSGLSTWKENDVKHFLRDRQIKFSDKESFEQLSKKAESEFERLQHFDTGSVKEGTQQQILNLATNPKDELANIFPGHHNWKYLFESSNDYYGQVRNWIFESWTVDGLRSFLKQNKIKFDKKAKKQDLINLAKDKYANVVKKHDVSGQYPGDWIYQGWSVDSLKQWLKDNGLEYDNKENKESLLGKVKQNNYVASLSIIDSKNSLLDSLNLANEKIFDKAGSIKDDFVDTWSYGQMREWLYFHGLIDTKPDVHVNDLDATKLRKLVKSHQNYLLDDIKSWSDEAKKTTNPYLSKGSDNKQKLENVINSTFLVGIEKWSKSRLRNFLDSRKVKYSQFASKNQLIDLVKKSKDVQIDYKQNANPASWLFENWSTESIRSWLEGKGQDFKGSRQDLINAVSKYLLSTGSSANDAIESQVNLYKPDLDDYKKSFNEALKNANEGAKDKGNAAKKVVDSVADTSIADGAMLSAYAIGAEYYKTAAKALSEKYSEAQFSLDDALSQAQKASYEYANNIADTVSGHYKENKPKVDESLKSASVAANEYAGSLSNTLAEQYKKSQKVLQDVTNDPREYLKSASDSLSKGISENKPIAEQAAKDAYKAAEEYLAYANDAVVRNYGEYKPLADDAANTIYESAKEYANVANDVVDKNYKEYKPKAAEAAQKAKEYADLLSEAAGKNYKDYEVKLSEAYGAATEAANAAYDDYKPVLEKTAQTAYGAAKDYASLAGDVILSTYAEAKPKVEQAVSNGWQYLLVSYSNADLRSYLQSFGVDYDFLSSLSRQQLVRLANEQTSVFVGGSHNKWDKSIVDVLKDTSDGFQSAVGLKQKDSSLWSKFKSYF